MRSEERLPAIINNSFDKVISGLPVPSPPPLELELEIQFVSKLQLNLAGSLALPAYVLRS